MTPWDPSHPWHLFQHYKHDFHPQIQISSCDIFSLSYKLEFPSDQDASYLLTVKIKAFTTTAELHHHPLLSVFQLLQFTEGLKDVIVAFVLFVLV